MAGAQTSLTLQDRLTGSLQKMMRAMDQTITVMEKMDNSTQQLDQKSLASARKSITNASADLERLTTSTENAAHSVNQAADQQERMNQAVKNIDSSGTERVAKSLGDASKSASDASKSFEDVSKSTTNASRTASDYSREMQRMNPTSVLERIRSLFSRVGRETEDTTRKQSRFQSALQKLRPSSALERLKSVFKQSGDNAEKASNQMDRMNNSMKSGEFNAKGLVAGLLSAIGAYKLLNSAVSGIKSMLSTGLDFHILKQSSEAAFTIFLGDAEKARQYMEDIYAFALTTPFQYPDLLDATRNLMAFGIEAENTFPIMQSIGDAVAGIGGGSEEMKRLADIFGVIQSQGRMTAMEVNRLGAMGINAYEMLGEAAGVSAEEMKKQITSGAVDASQAIEGLVQGMDKQFGGSMEGVKDTLVGTFDTFKSSIRNAGADLLEDFLEPIRRTVSNATNLIKDIPKYLGPAFAAVLPVIDQLNNALEAGNFDWFFQMMSVGLSTVAWFLSLVAQGAIWVAEIFSNNWSWIAPFLVTIGVILSIILVWVTMLKVGTLLWAAAMWVVNNAYLKNPIVIILMAVIAIVVLVIYAMIKWADTTATVIGFIVGMIYALGAVYYNVMMGIANFGIAVAEFFVNAWNQAIYFIQLAWIQFNIFIATILDSVGNAGLATAEFFIDVWNGAVFGVQTAFYHFMQFVLKITSAIASGVEGIVNGILDAISSIINTAISGINTMIGFINKVPGINIDTIGNVDLSVGNSVSSAIDDFSTGIAEPTKKAASSLGRLDIAGNYQNNVASPSAPQTTSFDRLDYKDPMSAYDKGFGIGHDWSTSVTDSLGGIADKIGGFLDNDMLAGGAPEPYSPTDIDMGQGRADALDKLAKGAGGSGSGSSPKVPKGASNPTGGKLDSIGSIDDDINIADEDLKLMLELADIRSIQNFRTLNPTVTFTGDMNVREEADIDKIVKKINQNFEEQMGESAEGVYS